jgi:hypothetical protein
MKTGYMEQVDLKKYIEDIRERILNPDFAVE